MENFDSLISVLKRQPRSESNPNCYDDLRVGLVGASFGGALTLLLHRSRPIARTLLIAPLLDLTHQRARGGVDFRGWFDSKFSTEDFRDISFGKFIGSSKVEPFAPDLHRESSRVCLIYGAQDEVLGQEMFASFSAALRSQRGHSVYCHDGSHVPVTYRDVMFQLTHAYRFLTESIETVCESAVPD